MDRTPRNRRQPIFFESGEQAVYHDVLARRHGTASVETLAYCPMPDHVHLILAPRSAKGLARGIGETHRQDSAFLNAWAQSRPADSQISSVA